MGMVKKSPELLQGKHPHLLASIKKFMLYFTLAITTQEHLEKTLRVIFNDVDIL